MALKAFVLYQLHGAFFFTHGLELLYGGVSLFCIGVVIDVQLKLERMQPNEALKGAIHLCYDLEIHNLFLFTLRAWWEGRRESNGSPFQLPCPTPPLPSAWEEALKALAAGLNADAVHQTIRREYDEPMAKKHSETDNNTGSCRKRDVQQPGRWQQTFSKVLQSVAPLVMRLFNLLAVVAVLALVAWLVVLLKPRHKCDFQKADNLYNILGIEKAASSKQVKSAYKNLAKHCHPDKVPQAERVIAEKGFIAIKEAIDILLNESLRKIYDTCGLEGIKIVQQGAASDPARACDIVKKQKLEQNEQEKKRQEQEKSAKSREDGQ